MQAAIIEKARRLGVMPELGRAAASGRRVAILGGGPAGFGAAAVRTLAEGKTNVMVALNPPVIRAVPLEEAISKMKSVPTDCDTILTARELGVCFGD